MPVLLSATPMDAAVPSWDELDEVLISAGFPAGELEYVGGGWCYRVALEAGWYAWIGDRMSGSVSNRPQSTDEGWMVGVHCTRCREDCARYDERGWHGGAVSDGCTYGELLTCLRDALVDAVR